MKSLLPCAEQNRWEVEFVVEENKRKCLRENGNKITMGESVVFKYMEYIITLDKNISFK